MSAEVEYDVDVSETFTPCVQAEAINRVMAPISALVRVDLRKGIRQSIVTDLAYLGGDSTIGSQPDHIQ
jgi:hypothetical protein